VVGVKNTQQGDFGEAWLKAAAAGADLVLGGDNSDLYKSDVRLTLLGVFGGMHNPAVSVQVKTTTERLGVLVGGVRSYNLDVETYEVLRQPSVTQSTPRVLAVIGLTPRRLMRVWPRPRGDMLLGVSRWVSLAGLPATSNRDTIAVHLPAANTFHPDSLRRMMVEHGVRRSTPVPLVSPWAGAAR